MSSFPILRFSCECDVSKNIGSCHIDDPPDFESMTPTEVVLYARERLMELLVMEAHLNYSLVQAERKDSFKALLQNSYKISAQVVHDLRDRIKELEEEARNPPPLPAESPFSAVMSFTSNAQLKKLEAENSKLREERSDLKGKLGELRALVDQQSKFGPCLSPEDTEKLAARLERNEAIDQELLKKVSEQKNDMLTQYQELYPKMLQEHHKKTADLTAQVNALTTTNRELQERAVASLQNTRVAENAKLQLDEINKKAKAVSDSNNTQIGNLKAALQKAYQRHEDTGKEREALKKQCEEYRSAYDSLNAKSRKFMQDTGAQIAKANAEADEATKGLQRELDRAKLEVSRLRSGPTHTHQSLSNNLSPSDLPEVLKCLHEACPHTIVSLMTKGEREMLGSRDQGVSYEYTLISYIRDVCIGKFNSKMKEIQVRTVPRKRPAVHAGRPSSTLSNRYNRPDDAGQQLPINRTGVPRQQNDPNYNTSNVYPNQRNKRQVGNTISHTQAASPVLHSQLHQTHLALNQPMTQPANGQYNSAPACQLQYQSEHAAGRHAFPTPAPAALHNKMSDYSSGLGSGRNSQGYTNQAMLHEAVRQQNRVTQASTAFHQSTGSRPIDLTTINNMNTLAATSRNNAMPPHVPSREDPGQPTTARKGLPCSNNNAVHTGQQQNPNDGRYLSTPRDLSRTSVLGHHINSISDHSMPQTHNFTGPQQQMYPEYTNQYSAMHGGPVQAVPGLEQHPFSPMHGGYMADPFMPNPSFNFEGAFQDIVRSPAFVNAANSFDNPPMPNTPGFQQGQKRSAPSSSPYDSDRAGPHPRLE